MQTKVIASAVIALGVTVPASGQVAQSSAASAANRSSANGRSSQLTAAAAQPAADVQSLMAADGGSILQATTPPPDNSALGGGGRTPSYGLYGVPDPEPHVLKKHDLVNIVVREESKSVSGGNSDQQRKVDFDAKVDAFVKFRLASFSLHPTQGSNPEVKAEGQRDFKGTGEYDRVDTMTTRLEAEVIDVKPNGNLVIQARRNIQVDEETIDVTLTGVCRVLDVDATNSVLSTDMHDLKLKKLTTGQVRDTTKRGLLHQVLDFLNPF